MALVSQLQMIEFVILLTTGHYIIKNITHDIDIPFLGIATTGVINILLFTIVPTQAIIWMIPILLTLATTYYLYKTQRTESSTRTPTEKTRYIYTYTAWAIAIAVAVLLFSTALLFPKSTFENDAHGIGNRTFLATQLFTGEDNFTHINIIQSINKTGNTLYFMSEQPNRFTIPFETTPYAQLPHAASSNVKTIFYDALHVTGHRPSDVTLIIISYLTMHYFLLGALVGVSMSLILFIINKFVSISTGAKILISILGTSIALRLFMCGILRFGFFSQSAGLIGLLLSLLIELYFTQNKEIRLVNKSVLRIIILILIGHTWWILAPITFCLIGIQTAADLRFSIRLRRWKEIASIVLIFAFGTLIALIPAIVQVVRVKTDLVNLSLSHGPVLAISVKHITLYMFAVSMCCLVAYLVLKKDRPFFQPIIVFSSISFLSLLIFALYFLSEDMPFKYYIYKYAWSIAWIPFITVIIILVLSIYMILIPVINRYFGSVAIHTAIITLIILVSVITYNYTKIISMQSTLLQGVQNPQQVSDLLNAIDTANKEKRIVISISDCMKPHDYFYQKAANSLQAEFTDQSIKYFKGTIYNYASEAARRELRNSVLNQNPDTYYYFDSTPLQDLDSPSDRLPSTRIKGSRTQLNAPWSRESNSYCRNEITSSYP